ncbi:alpha-1,2-fucosyltransferase [Sporomusa aerivorans]|uniref:alpha-1,2-fucosyltransferase n=1 Tax=Sporomusa aerivorans TaxID=204936 RepID=UPI00352A6678
MVELLGGIGNQMFQYAAARELAERLQTPLKLDITWFSRAHKGDITPREYALHNFNIQASMATPSERKMFIREKFFRGKIGQLWRRYIDPDRNVFQEASFCFDPRFLQVTGPLYLKGYWQSEKYFIDIATTIKREFSVPSLSETSKAYLEKIRNSKAVSLHVRRGDYVTNQAANSFHGCCSIEYYLKSIHYLQQEFEGLEFYIFSDDLAWVRENLPIDAMVYYVDSNGGATPHEELELMRNCSHHIIANSSFSWWGAWLNYSDNKKVIAPRTWFMSKLHDTKDLLPSSWIRL